MVESTYREKTRAAMVAIAERILAGEGLTALQARRVAREANCAVGTLYNIFDGLDELIIAANAHALDQLGRSLLDARTKATERSVEGRLLAMALAYLDFARSHEHAWRAVFEHRMVGGQPIPQWYRDNQARLFALVEQVLNDTGIVPASRNPAARALFAAVHGIVTLALDQKLGRSEHRDAQAQVRFVVSAVAAGLLPASAAFAGAHERPG